MENKKENTKLIKNMLILIKKTLFSNEEKSYYNLYNEKFEFNNL